MSELPAVSGKQAVRAFERLGFTCVRVSGSHHILKKERHPKLLSVPVHKNQSLKRGTLNGLISDSGHTKEEFLAALND